MFLKAWEEARQRAGMEGFEGHTSPRVATRSGSQVRAPQQRARKRRRAAGKGAQGKMATGQGAASAPQDLAERLQRTEQALRELQAAQAELQKLHHALVYELTQLKARMPGSEAPTGAASRTPERMPPSPPAHTPGEEGTL